MPGDSAVVSSRDQRLATRVHLSSFRQSGSRVFLKVLKTTLSWGADVEVILRCVGGVMDGHQC